ncbi:MAG: DUF1570 domain-containing protein [Planctomycetota bacterium]|nr:DUF1570 domain-containing protein [Planctomycetota bacterium]
MISLPAKTTVVATRVLSAEGFKADSRYFATTWLWGILFLPSFVSVCVSQNAPVGDPAVFGIPLPKGEVKWADRKVNAYIKTPTGHTIGRVHVKVGDHFIVIMPDGSLVGKKASEVKFTDKPVEWATPDELANQATTGMLENFNVIKRKKHVFVYNTSPKMAEVTARVMESMTRGLIKYMKTLGLKPHEPEVPLVVIMFKTQEQFQAFKRMPPGVVAYYNIITNRVYLYEESPWTKIDRELAIAEKLSTIAHEGAHQVLANIGIQQRLSLWPMWFSEGMAEFLAPTETGRGMQWKGPGKVNDFRMLELETYLRSKAIEGIDGHVTRNTAAAARLTSTGYASAWSLTNYLAKRKRDQFKDYLSKVAGLRPFEGSFPTEAVQGKIAKNVKEFEEFFGPDWKELETDMIRFLTRQKFESPFAEFIHYAVLIEVPTLKKTVKAEKHSAVFHTQGLAERWANEFYKKNDGAAKPIIRIMQCKNRAEAIRQTNLFYNSRQSP